MAAAAAEAPESQSPTNTKYVAKLRITPYRLSFLLFLFGIVYFQYTIPLEEVLHRKDNTFAVSKHEFLKPGQFDHGKIKYQNLTDPPVLVKPAPRYFMVFSTSCTDQQDWESYLFFFNAFKAQQTGTVTRIASGCDEKRKAALIEFHRDYVATLNPNFKIHFTPDFSRVKSKGEKQKPQGGLAYKYMNKPYGLKHWMEHSLGIYSNGTNPKGALNWIIMLLDPDMVLSRPMTHNFTDVDNHLWVEKKPTNRIVAHGNPIAQQDGYLSNEWMKLDLPYITGKPKATATPGDGGYVDRPVYHDGPIHWNTGPPYLATAKDMRDIVEKWVDYAPRVYDVHPKLFAEMYGYIIATLQLKLPHTLIKSLVVSTTGARDREGWALIDALQPEEICKPPINARLPVGLHYCKRYRLGRYFFSKYRVRKNIMSCDVPLLSPVPTNLLEKGIDWAIIAPTANPKDNVNYTEVPEKLVTRPHRELFMLCAMTQHMNEALRFYKQRACINQGKGADLNTTYNVYDHPLNF